MRKTALKFRLKDERGQALLEFALIFTLVIILLFGIAEFGRGWYYSNVVSNAVRAGARFASLQPKGTNYVSNVRNYTFAQATTTSVRANDNFFVNVSAYAIDGSPRTDFVNMSGVDSVKVIGSYRFEIVTAQLLPFFTGNKSIVRKATMRYTPQL